LNYYKTIDKMKEEANDFVEKYKDTPYDKIPEKDADRIIYLNKVLNLEIDRRAAGEALATERYRKLAGEVEARNVERRLYRSKADNRYDPPSETADVQEIHQMPTAQPMFATPYGYQAGTIEPPMPASSKPTTFRRAANDNEAPLDMKPLDDALGKSMDDVFKESRDWLAKYDAYKAMPEPTGANHNEVYIAKYNKAAQEALGENFTPVKYDPKYHAREAESKARKERIEARRRIREEAAAKEAAKSKIRKYVENLFK
jgi:hypothetical protein